jgi:site-specific DNA-methyltransferase (adenine-specific)
VMCDDVFGHNNFRNEIVWCYRGAGYPKKDFGRRHDTIFRYSKGDDYKFNLDDIREEYAEATKERFSHYIGNVRGDRDYGVQKLNPLGKQPDDWWQIQPIAPSAKERLGYPTQKPEALLERIIQASSNSYDLVFDCFCACGTTLVAAQKLGRRWLGIDVSPTGCKLVQYRLSKLGVRAEIIGLPRTIEELKQLSPIEFQNWVIGAAGGRVSDRKSRDMGIDGYTFYGLYGEKEYPIAVKRMEKVGRIWVDNFETAMRRKGFDKGYIVAFDFTKDAYEEVARAKSEGLHIELVKVDEIKKRFLEGFMETLKEIH